MAHPDLDELLNVLLAHAQSLLKRYGEFYPFGASMDVTGGVRILAAHQEANRPNADAIVEMLTDGCRRDAKTGTIRAAGICMDARAVMPTTGMKSDCICAKLDHVHENAVNVFLPYKKTDDGQMQYEDLFAEPIGHFIFRPL